MCISAIDQKCRLFTLMCMRVAAKFVFSCKNHSDAIKKKSDIFTSTCELLIKSNYISPFAIQLKIQRLIVVHMRFINKTTVIADSVVSWKGWMKVVKCK